ncbi:unnamed protein product [Sphenostylis stenocarpa]|uniref:Uncharacterized protein n=1 Tax=Sphenostylis stenocarpa TaxID=92480 RepID=A0AA86W2Q2_9FABA|nr:unnamed protein product [Sphenostylis stenocarpa]
MNTFGSEICSSGCESGWTLYLEHSFFNQNASSHRGGTEACFEVEHMDKRFKDEDSGEEDLSMVSDASSGPPHFPHYESYLNEDVSGCFHPASKAVKPVKSGKKKQKVKENQHLEDQHLTSVLHDTASSPVFDFSTNNATRDNRQTSVGSVVDYSQGFSATYFENHLYSCREDLHSKKNTLVSYNQKINSKATNGMEGKAWEQGMGNEEVEERRGGNMKVDVGVFSVSLFKSLLRSGDPACDLPDPNEHAPFCIVCQLYLFWKDPLLKYDM